MQIAWRRYARYTISVAHKFYEGYNLDDANRLVSRESSFASNLGADKMGSTNS